MYFLVIFQRKRLAMTALSVPEGWITLDSWGGRKLDQLVDVDLAKVTLQRADVYGPGSGPLSHFMNNFQGGLLGDHTLQAFLNTPHQIPENWKRKVNGRTLQVSFLASLLWGKMMADDPEETWVRHLQWNEEESKWSTGFGTLHGVWRPWDVVAILSS